MRATPMCVRLATPADAPAFAAADSELFGRDAWSQGSYAEEITGPGRVYLVAEVDGELAGYAGLWFDGDDAHIMTIGTLAPWQRQGVAAALLARLESQATRLGAARILLEVAVTNAPALALYAGAGFVEMGRRKRYYRDGTDALTMNKNLSAGPQAGAGPQPISSKLDEGRQ